MFLSYSQRSTTLSERGYIIFKAWNLPLMSYTFFLHVGLFFIYSKGAGFFFLVLNRHIAFTIPPKFMKNILCPKGKSCVECLRNKNLCYKKASSPQLSCIQELLQTMYNTGEKSYQGTLEIFFLCKVLILC